MWTRSGTGAGRRRAPWRWLALLVAAVTVAAAPTYAAAAPASVKWVAYDGRSISMLRVPAQPVVLTALSSSPFDSATFSVAGRAGTVRSTTVASSGGQFRASAEVDLTGASGRTTVTVVYIAGRVSSTVRKVLVAAPVPPGANPSPAVRQAPTTQATPTPVPAPQAAPPPVTEAPVTTTSAPPSGSAAESPPVEPAPVGEPEVANPTTSVPADDLVPAPAELAVAARTGVPDGVVLTPRSGTVTITQRGTVIDGWDLAGCIVVRADDVTIRNSRVRCISSTTAMVIATNGSFRNLVVEDSEIDGGGGVDIGVGWQNFTLRRVEITGVNDGVRAGSNSTIENSWVHDMTRRGGLHPDAIQSTGGTGLRITGNVLDPRNLSTGDLNNAAIMMGSETTGVLADVLISGNQLGGGNYTVNIRGDSGAQNVILSGNIFTGGARYGPVRAPAAVTVDTGNILSTTGAVVRVVPSG